MYARTAQESVCTRRGRELCSQEGVSSDRITQCFRRARLTVVGMVRCELTSTYGREVIETEANRWTEKPEGPIYNEVVSGDEKRNGRNKLLTCTV